MTSTKAIGWEILNPDDSALKSVRRLYESTLDIDERIPWEWIERSVARRAENASGGRWSPHLLACGLEDAAGSPSVAGFAFGGYFPGYGGYVCYLGVDPDARRHGFATLLFEKMFEHLKADAQEAGQSLPFVLWESQRPGSRAPEAAWKLWTVRMRLFHRVGGQWLRNVPFQSPNYHDQEAPPLELQLFLKPMEEVQYSGKRLEEVVRGLHQYIYRHDPDDELVRDSLLKNMLPMLVPTSEAESRPCLRRPVSV